MKTHRTNQDGMAALGLSRQYTVQPSGNRDTPYAVIAPYNPKDNALCMCASMAGALAVANSLNREAGLQELPTDTVVKLRNRKH